MKQIIAAALLVSAAPAVAQDAPPAAVAAPASIDQAKTADLFNAPPPDKGQVVFYRPGGAGGLVGCMVREGEGADETHLSKLTGNRYFTRLVDPGVHHYWAKSEATDRLTLEVEPGETYFVKCKISMGLVVGRPNLSPSELAEFNKYSKHLKPMAAESEAAVQPAVESEATATQQ